MDSGLIFLRRFHLLMEGRRSECEQPVRKGCVTVKIVGLANPPTSDQDWNREPDLEVIGGTSKKSF